jgi:hypothetical protein
VDEARVDFSSFIGEADSARIGGWGISNVRGISHHRHRRAGSSHSCDTKAMRNIPDSSRSILDRPDSRLDSFHNSKRDISDNIYRYCKTDIRIHPDAGDTMTSVCDCGYGSNADNGADSTREPLREQFWLASSMRTRRRVEASRVFRRLLSVRRSYDDDKEQVFA